MAYRRRRTYKRGYKPLIKRLAKQVRQMKVQVEKKHYTVSVSDQPIGSILTFFPLQNISQGSNSMQRVGNNISTRSLYLQLYFRLPDTSVSGYFGQDEVRLIICSTRGGTSSFSSLDFALTSPVLTDKYGVIMDKYITSLNNSYVYTQSSLNYNGGGTSKAVRLKIPLRRKLGIVTQYARDGSQTVATPDLNIILMTRNAQCMVAGFYDLIYSDS